MHINLPMRYSNAAILNGIKDVEDGFPMLHIINVGMGFVLVTYLSTEENESWKTSLSQRSWCISILLWGTQIYRLNYSKGCCNIKKLPCKALQLAMQSCMWQWPHVTFPQNNAVYQQHQWAIDSDNGEINQNWWWFELYTCFKWIPWPQKCTLWHQFCYSTYPRNEARYHGGHFVLMCQEHICHKFFLMPLYL